MYACGMDNMKFSTSHEMTLSAKRSRMHMGVKIDGLSSLGRELAG